MGTGYQDHPETLLAVVGAATANLVVLPPAVLAQEEGPLLPPFLAPAHRSLRSGVPRPSRAFSGVGLSAHSRFASARRSRMEGFVVVKHFCNISFEKFTMYVLLQMASSNHYTNGDGYDYTIRTHIS